MEVERDVSAFLKSQKALVPQELKSFYDQFDDLYLKKLWHQLTVELEAFHKNPLAQKFLIPLYHGFIIDFETKVQLLLFEIIKVNQLTLVQLFTLSITSLEPKAALEFLMVHLERLRSQKSDTKATLLCLVMCSHYKLLTLDPTGCFADIQESQKIMDDLNIVEPVISAAFYKVSADYYKSKAIYPQYYHNALLFLSTVDITNLKKQDLVERAHDLVISALLGENLYNFGELLSHPILDSLISTPFEWMRTLLFTFNNGDIDAFDKISTSVAFKQISLFTSSMWFMKQKLCIMTLVESIFKRSREQRNHLPFQTISQECRVPIDEVEHLVMKSLSLGLIKGKIDQVDCVIRISWVQPRVMDKEQIRVVMSRLSSWVTKVKSNVEFLESNQLGSILVEN